MDYLGFFLGGTGVGSLVVYLLVVRPLIGTLERLYYHGYRPVNNSEKRPKFVPLPPMPRED